MNIHERKETRTELTKNPQGAFGDVIEPQRFGDGTEVDAPGAVVELAKAVNPKDASDGVVGAVGGRSVNR